MTPKQRLGDIPARTLSNNSLFFYDINPYSCRRRLSAGTVILEGGVGLKFAFFTVYRINNGFPSEIGTLSLAKGIVLDHQPLSIAGGPIGVVRRERCAVCHLRQ